MPWIVFNPFEPDSKYSRLWYSSLSAVQACYIWNLKSYRILKLFDKNSVLCVVALSYVLNAMAPVPPKNFLLLLSVRQRKTFHEALPKNFGYFVHQKSYQDDHFYCLPTPSWSLVVEFWIWEWKTVISSSVTKRVYFILLRSIANLQI